MSETFVDPRDQPLPSSRPAPRDPAKDPKAVAPLIQAIDAGRIYEVEKWIADGSPIQFTYPADRRKSPQSPLQAALRTGQHDLVLLLLCNGYQTDLERFSPFTEALRVGRSDLVHLLIEWNADPKTADANEVVRCYDVELIETLWRRGVDLTPGNALAGAVAHNTSNRPLYGFLKRHAHEDPILQRALNRGLCFAIEHPLSNQDPEKAVAMCIWAGADPWGHVPYDFERVDDTDPPEEAAEWSPHQCAAGRALRDRHVALLPALKLNPDDPRFPRLYEAAWDASAYEALARIRPPTDPSRVANQAIAHLGYSLDRGHWRECHLLEAIFKSGGRLLEASEEACRGFQRFALKADVRFEVRPLVRLLQDPSHADEAAFLRLVHSPAIIRRNREFGITRQSLERLAALPTTSTSVAGEVRRALRPKRRGSMRARQS